MIKNYFLITWRSMMKNKMFLFINILGLSVAIGCCIVAYFNWEFSAQFDAHHTNRDNIYRINSIREFEGQSTVYGFVPLPLGPIIKTNMPDADKVVRLSGSYSNLKVGDNLFPANLQYVDPDLFEVFTFEFINGQPGAIKDKSKLVISDELAIKLFGSTEVVGKQITQVMGTDLKELEVGGVYKIQPGNSSFDASAYMNYENYFDEAKELKQDDWKSRNTVFVQVTDKSRLNTFTEQLQSFRENNNKVREDFIIREFTLDPLVGMARRDEANDTWSQTKEGNPTAAIIAPIAMAVLVLLIACFNMTNTAIAISSRRLKEIGIRKVMGSMRSQIIVQFIGETTFICFIALLLGLVFGEILIGSWNSLWEYMKLESHYLDSPGFLIFLIGILAFTALIAGSYPAFYISRFEPVSILKGKLKFGGTNVFTMILLCLQYAISLMAIIFAVAFYQNSIFQKEFDIGFDTDGVIIAYVNSQGEYETYRNALLQNKDIVSIAGSEHSIFSSRYNDPVKHESRQLEVDIINVGDDYLSTMGLTLIEGRDFQRDSENDRKESVLITEKFAESFGWEEPLGKEVIWMDSVKLHVVGVVKNVYTSGLWREMQPLMIRYTTPDKYSHVIVSAPMTKLKDVNAFMEKEWKQIFPNRLYNGRRLQEDLSQAATVNNNIVKMFAFLGIVALILSATGLFTLVSLNIIKKMKEIGVRKVLGASISNITRIINTEFMIILLAASILGAVASFFMVDIFMSSIWRYYQSLTVVTIVASIALLIFISICAIGYKIYSAASINPVTTLRNE